MTTARHVRGVGRRAHRRAHEGGAVIVEFALLVPILLLIVFGIIQYGMYFYASQGGSDVARDLARRAAVSDPSIRDCNALRAKAVAATQELTGTKNVTVTRTYVDRDTNAIVTAPSLGDTVRIRLTFDSFDLQMPVLPFVDHGRVTSQAEARVDYLPSTGVLPGPCP